MRQHPRYNNRLARFFEIASGKTVGWDDRELFDIFHHQLRAPLLADLRPLASELKSLGLSDVATCDPPLTTFADLLNHPCPKLSLLNLAKDFAKAADSRLETPLPSPVATALYILIIAAALVIHGKKITDMDHTAMQNGLTWVEHQDWIDATLRELAARAMAVPIID